MKVHILGIIESKHTPEILRFIEDYLCGNKSEFIYFTFNASEKLNSCLAELYDVDENLFTNLVLREGKNVIIGENFISPRELYRLHKTHIDNNIVHLFARDFERELQKCIDDAISEASSTLESPKDILCVVFNLCDEKDIRYIAARGGAIHDINPTNFVVLINYLKEL